MNKQDKYKLILFTLIDSGVNVVLRDFEVTNPDLKTCLSVIKIFTRNHMDKLVNRDIKTARWTHRRLKEWRADLNESDHGMNITTLVACSYQAAIDLSGIEPIVKEILPPLEQLSDFFHIGVKSTMNYERADKTLKPLYDRIGFKP